MQVLLRSTDLSSGTGLFTGVRMELSLNQPDIELPLACVNPAPDFGKLDLHKTSVRPALNLHQKYTGFISYALPVHF